MSFKLSLSKGNAKKSKKNPNRAKKSKGGLFTGGQKKQGFRFV